MSNPLAKVIRYIVTGGTITASDAQAAIEQLETITTNISGLLSSHKSRHENGGADEISVLGLSGLLADGQNPLGHKSSHENNGSDEISVAGLSGLLADEQNAGKIKGFTIDVTGLTADYIIKYNGTQFVVSNTVPGLLTSHQATHIESGSDQITGELFSPQKAGKIFSAAINITGLADTWVLRYDNASGTWIAQTFNHAASHEIGQPDAISSLPSSSEKLALAGTAGTPSGTNKFVTQQQTDPVLPTTNEKAALAGTSGTPSAINKYVTQAQTDPVLPSGDQKAAMNAASSPNSLNPFITLSDLTGSGTLTISSTSIALTKAFIAVTAVVKQGTPVEYNISRDLLSAINFGDGLKKPIGLVNKLPTYQSAVEPGSCVFNSAGTITVTDNVTTTSINSITFDDGFGHGVVNVTSVGIIKVGDMISISGSSGNDGSYIVHSIMGLDITIVGLFAVSHGAIGSLISTKFYKDRIIVVSGTSLNNESFTITNVAGNVLSVNPAPVNETSTCFMDYYFGDGEIILSGLMTIEAGSNFDPSPSVVTTYYYDTSSDGYGTTPNNFCIGEQYSSTLFNVDIRKSYVSSEENIRITNTDSPYTVSVNNRNIICDCSGGNIAITLPAITQDWHGISLIVKARAIGSNSITITCNAADDIDGGASVVLNVQYQSWTLLANYDVGGNSYWSIV